MARSYSLYLYDANKVAPVAFCVLFAISTIYHVYQNFKFKAWKITGALPWGGLLYVAGFAVREVSIFHDRNLGIFIASNVLLQLAPPVYSLTNYLVLGRTFYYVPYLSPMHPGRVISTFVGLDTVVGILTGNGAAKVINSSESPQQVKIGAALIRASIVLQLACFAGFVALEIIFHRRCLRVKIMNTKLRTVLYLLYASSGLIMIRNIYRTIEVWEGYDGYLATHEAYFWILDSALLLINSTMLNKCHPMAHLPHSYKVYLARDGVTEVEGTGCIDERSLLATIFDPFDLVGLIRGKDKTQRHWEERKPAPTNPAVATA